MNNAIMYLFDRVTYKLSEREIEEYSYPGVASTMKGLLTYPSECNSASQFIWALDNGKSMKNKGLIDRKKFYLKKDNDRKFSVILPLDHIFGFCENYRKVMYGVIIKSARQREIGGETRDSVADGKIDIKKISWHMSHIQLIDQAQLSLYSDIK